MDLLQFLKNQRGDGGGGDQLRLVAARTKLAEGDLRDIALGKMQMTDEIEAVLKHHYQKLKLMKTPHGLTVAGVADKYNDDKEKQ
jgi:hypothetical protein